MTTVKHTENNFSLLFNMIFIQIIIYVDARGPIYTYKFGNMSEIIVFYQKDKFLFEIHHETR